MVIISQKFKMLLSHVNQFMYESKGNIWFRGHSNIGYDGKHIDYTLDSSLFRVSDDLDNVKRLEQSYIYEFMTKGYSLHQTKNEWDLLYVMQHHGTPTRLLDWSSSLSTALYFATRGWDRNLNAPSVWLLNPSKLNSALNDKETLIMPRGDFEKYINRENLSSHAIAPIYNSPRLIAQQGQFTLQGNFNGGLDEELTSKLPHHSNILTEIKITPDLFEDVISYLHMNGVNDFSIFPDLDGLSRLVSKRRGSINN